MRYKGISQYKAAFRSEDRTKEHLMLDLIMQKANIYNINFLENRDFLESVLTLKNETVAKDAMGDLQELLVWVLKTQESAPLS